MLLLFLSFIAIPLAGKSFGESVQCRRWHFSQKSLAETSAAPIVHLLIKFWAGFQLQN